MNGSTPALEREIHEAIAKVARTPVVGRDTLQDVGIGSLAFIRLVIHLERAFGITFDDEDIDAVRFTTVDEVTRYVLQRLGDRGRESATGVVRGNAESA
jgi:acyl carrier protein